jgi:DNA-binding CsgD family transcriptional regulator
MTHTIVGLVESFVLPPNGIDLRAELDALRSARVSQAMAQSGGDVGRAARLLRMSRRDLLLLEARLARGGPSASSEGAEPKLDASLPRIERGVEFVSAAVIRGLHADGLTQRRIAERLGCNPYLVEKVLRKDTENEVRRLAGEGRSASDIADALRLPLTRVRRILKRAAIAALRASGVAAAPGNGERADGEESS